uniref:Cilia and flagella associated protein 54 n=1 Tax=Stegastes partitus TaxID=144197 RepID=A0A3B4ZVX1_9TELE
MVVVPEPCVCVCPQIRAMHGCALCLFEQEKKHNILSQKGLCKLLRVLNFIRIIMKAFQRHEHLHWQIYNGIVALEYLLWASISLELSIPLMTAKYLPFIVTLYCAVCHCYYDNQAEVQAEKFARRALGKINELAKLELQSQVPATRETQRAYKEASIKLAAMIFKQAVFNGRKKPKARFRMEIKNTPRDIPNAPLPCTPTERLLLDLFDSRAGQFLGILEALWDSTTRPLQMRMPDDPEKQEVFSELLSAGISILSGENKVPIMSAVRFIKLSFQYKQRDVFTEFAREMQQVLSVSSTQAIVILITQKSEIRSVSVSLLLWCFQLESDVQPDGDLVLDIVLFVWSRMKVVRQKNQLQTSKFAHYRQKVDDNYISCMYKGKQCCWLGLLLSNVRLLLISSTLCIYTHWSHYFFFFFFFNSGILRIKACI